tara:strand:+ start:123 stop:1073 length:951 start_codon:yes stop_codon:yes gene_type:complete
MKKILIYEHFTGGGLLNEDLSSDLMNDAKLILLSIMASCDRSYNYDYNYFLDYRLTDYRTDRSIITNESEDLYNLSLIKKYDYILPILPEIDSNLSNYVKFIEKNNIKKVISDTRTIDICSDKLIFYEYMTKHTIPVIPTYKSLNFKNRSDKYILKDRLGAGCSYVRLTKKNELEEYYSENMIVQPFIDGDHYSLSVFFSKSNFRLLTINKQNIGTTNCMLSLKSLIINVNQNLYLDILPIISNIKNSLPGLFGFVGIDFLLRGRQIYIVEINPRLTTSFSGLYETIGCNMIDLLINHKYIKNVITGRELCLSSNE